MLSSFFLRMSHIKLHNQKQVVKVFWCILSNQLILWVLSNSVSPFKFCESFQILRVLSNFVSPCKFYQVKSQKKKLVLRMIKLVFTKKNWIWLELFMKNTFYHSQQHSRPVFCGKLTWWNLRGLAELANLTVMHDYEW